MKKGLLNVFMKRNLLHIFAITLLIWSCSSDDSPQPIPTGKTDEKPTLSELQGETMGKLTENGKPTVWKIETAQLSAGSEILDVTSNFNVADDEFIFSGSVSNGSLEWRRGHDLNMSASSMDETLLDYYRSPKSSAFSFVGERSSDLVSDDFDINVAPDGTVTATISGSGSDTAKNGTVTGKGGIGELVMTLVKKNPDDYKAPPTGGLQFSEAFRFGSTSIEGYSPGMIGSNSDNSFFLVNREDALKENEAWGPERVIKFNIDDFSQEEYVYTNPEFLDNGASKQLHVVNNELIAFGGRYVNTYDLNLSGDPTTVPHGLVSEEFDSEIMFTRFGIAVQDDNVYVIGGGFVPSEGFDTKEARNIYKWDLETMTPTLFASLPERRYGARGTIVNNKMYVFGGSLGFYDDTPTNTIYVIDMDNPKDIQTLTMPKKLSFSFVQKHQNLIYVAGTTLQFDTEGNPSGRESTIHVFDTQDNSIKEISHNLNNPDGFHSIHQMALFNGKMFVIYGGMQGEELPDSIYDEWFIYGADLE